MNNPATRRLYQRQIHFNHRQPKVLREVSAGVGERGLQLASRYAADPAYFEVLGQLPQTSFRNIVNKPDIVRALAFDKWVGNCDSRQVVFARKVGQRRFQAMLIDQSYCFNASQWTFPDLPFMGT